MATRETTLLETPAIRAALEHAVALGERSVQVSAYLKGELIVDARIGPAGPDAVFPIFSVSKAITSIAVHLQADRGLIDLEAPIATYWPEYARNGKQAVTVRHVLTHRGGVPQMPPGASADDLDWDRMVARLADLEPLFEPGTTNAYYSMAFGWILGEVVRRSDPQGRSFAQFVDQEMCRPLGIEDFWFGIPEAVAPRVATLDFPDEPPPSGPDQLVTQTLPPAIDLVPRVFNRPDVQRAVLPAVGGIGNARSVARFFAMLAGGGKLGDVRLLSENMVRSMLQPYPGTGEIDRVNNFACPMGMGGMWLMVPLSAAGGGSGQILSHPAAGGTLAYADLDKGLAVVVCHDRMFARPPEHPFLQIDRAIHERVAELS